MEYNTTYGFNMFVRMKGGNFMASGEGLGDLKTETQITGDSVYPEEHLYSDTFVPIRIRGICGDGNTLISAEAEMGDGYR